MKYVGKNIRRLRQKEGWSQSEVASKLNISVPAFSKIETGITDINISRLNQIATLFGTTAAAILIEDGTLHQDQSKLKELAELEERLMMRDQEMNTLQKKLIRMYEELRMKSHI